MNKEVQKKLAKIFCLTDILITEIDEPSKRPTKQSRAILEKAKELQEILEPVLDKFYQNKEVQKTLFFQTMANKIEYIFNKEFK